MNIPYVFKRCGKCGEWLVACKVNFYKNKGKKYRLASKCKKCEAEQKKQWYKENRDKIVECHKQYYENNKDKIVEKQKQYRENNKDKKAEYDKQYRENNKDKIAERNKQYYENNKDKILEKQKQYYENNKDKILEQQKQYSENNKYKIAERNKQYYENNKDKHAKWMKQWYKENRDKILEQKKQYSENNKYKIAKYHKQYYKNNKDKIAERNKQYYKTLQGQVVRFNSYNKRRIKEQEQGNGITTEQWRECMSFFDWKCAYSGETLTKDSRSLDHIKPLNRGGEHEIWNLVPMYKNYNSSKKDKDLLEWYKEQTFFSEERLNKIYEWQEYAYKKMHDKEEII